jgi:hypothetical protein
MPWSDYFGKVHDCWVRPKLRFRGKAIDAKTNAYQEAIERIDTRGTVLLAFRTLNGQLSGQVGE